MENEYINVQECHGGEIKNSMITNIKDHDIKCLFFKMTGAKWCNIKGNLDSEFWIIWNPSLLTWGYILYNFLNSCLTRNNNCAYFKVNKFYVQFRFCGLLFCPLCMLEVLIFSSQLSSCNSLCGASQKKTTW